MHPPYGVRRARAAPPFSLLVGEASGCYSSSPPEDMDSKISLHSGHTGYFFGSRFGTQTLPHSAITGEPFTALSMILFFFT
jgi:hypothetical protein